MSVSAFAEFLCDDILANNLRHGPNHALIKW